MVLRALFPIAVLIALGGCAALGEPVRDADGCIPAVTIYQPPVRLGGTGQVLHIPRSCPPPVTMSAETMALLASVGAAHAADQQAERGPPPPPVRAPAAIRQGIEKFCGWFFGDQPYSLEGLRQAAFDAGYRRAAPVPFFPSPEMLREPSVSAVGFTAMVEAPPDEAHGIAAFVSFHHPICQIQIYGYEAEAEAVVGALEADGWRSAGEAVPDGAATSVQRYFGVLGGRPMTMVVTRVTPEGGAGLEMVVNLVPGEDRERGLLYVPPG
jgi:hypothetical protein